MRDSESGGSRRAQQEESTDRACVDGQIRRLVLSGDVYAGAGPDLGVAVAVDGDGGVVGVVSEVEPVVGAGVADQCGGAGFEVAGVFAVVVDE